jgi:hypothetical protein
MTRRLGMLVAMLVAGTAAVPVLADLPLGPVHLIVGDPGAQIWHYKADPNNENSADKSKSSLPATPVVVDDLKPGDVVRFSIPDLIHGFTPVDGNGTTKLGLVVRCGEDAKDVPGAVLQELDCQPGQASKVDVKLSGDKVRLQVLQTFSDPVQFICTQHRARMSGRLQLQK